MKYHASHMLTLVGCSFALTSVQATEYSFRTYSIPYPEATTFANPNNINNSGTVTGYYYDASGHKYGFKENYGTFTRINDPDADNYTAPVATNEEGVTVGHYRKGTAFHQFFFDGTNFTNFDVPYSNVEAMSFGINDFDEAVGWYRDSANVTRGFRYDGVQFSSFTNPDGTNIFPFDINNQRHISGYYQDAQGYHGFLFDGTTYQKLDYPGYPGRTAVFGMNEKDQLVGYYVDFQGKHHGFTYLNGNYATLDYPQGTQGSEAVSINDLGQVVGTYTNSTGTRVFVATPVVGTPTAVPVLESRYEPGRSGANLHETELTIDSVNPIGFGRLFSLPVDGQLYAQPLYVPNVQIPGKGTHNVLYVATMNDIVYAFDADQPGSPLWTLNLANKTIGRRPVPIADIVGTNNLNIAGNVGIESTPIIDPTTGLMYLVARTQQESNGKHEFRLYALDIATGTPKLNSPMVISGTYTRNGQTLTFDPSIHNQRAGLALAKDKVIVTFGGHEDRFHYYGWMMAFNKTTLNQEGTFTTVANPYGYGGAVWQAGRAPVVDADGNFYVYVGNAFGNTATDYNTLVATHGTDNFSMSALKFDPSRGVVDWYAPSNYQYLDEVDLDMSASGPMLIPGTNILAGGGKGGTLYLLDKNNLGHYTTDDTQIIQKVDLHGGSSKGGPTFWSRTPEEGGSRLYYWGGYEDDPLTQTAPLQPLQEFSFNGTTVDPTPMAKSSALTAFPGGVLSLTANGGQSNTGIVWALAPVYQNADHKVVRGVLRAFMAEDVRTELWNSEQNAERDGFGLLAKFTPPVVTNGKAYIATSSNQVVVYGRLPSSPDFTLTAYPAKQVALGNVAEYTVKEIPLNGFTDSVNLTVDQLPPSATASFVAGEHGDTVLRLNLAPGTPGGSYRLMIHGSGSGLAHSQAVLLEVPDAASTVAVSATADSSQSDHLPTAAIDGDKTTFWITAPGATGVTDIGYLNICSDGWGGTCQTVDTSTIHEIVLDLGEVKTVSGLSYLPRQDGCSDGTLFQYSVFLGLDGTTWPKEQIGGSFDYGPKTGQLSCDGASFPGKQSLSWKPTQARYVRLLGINQLKNAGPWAAAAEVTVYATTGKWAYSGSYLMQSPVTWLTAGIAGASLDPGANVVLTPYGGGADQHWFVVPSMITNKFKLVNALSGMALEIPAGAPVPGAPLFQNVDTNAATQAFDFGYHGNGLNVQTGNAGYCTEPVGGTSVAGAELTQALCSYSAAGQEWWFTPLAP